MIREALERGLVSWGNFSARHAGGVIASSLLLALGLGSQLPRLTVETSTDRFLHERDPARVLYDEFRVQYGRDDVIVIAIEPPEIFDLEFLESLRNFHRELEEKVPHVDRVESLINARETLGRGDTLVVRDLLEDWPRTREEVEDLERRVLANPLYLNVLISEDARVTTISLRTDAYSRASATGNAVEGFDALDAGVVDEPPIFITGEENAEAVAAVASALDRFRTPGLSLWMAGGPYLSAHIADLQRADMGRFFSLSLAAIAVALFVLFRRVAAVLLPLAAIGLSILSSFGAMGLLGVPVGLPTMILPSFLLAVGIGASVHLLVIFFQAYDGGASPEASIVHALEHSGLAIAMTAATTAGGLASFTAAAIEPVQALGVVAPLGIGVGLVFCLGLLPALLVRVPLARRPPASTPLGSRRIERLLVSLGSAAASRPWQTVAVASLLLLGALGGMTKLTTTYDPLRWFPEDDPLRVGTEEIDRRLRGSIALEFSIDTHRPWGLHEPQVLGKLDQLAQHVSTLQGGDGLAVGKTISLVDIVKEINQALHANQPEFLRIPESRALVAQELLLFENSDRDDLERLVDSQFRRGRVTMRIPNGPLAHLSPFIDEIESVANELFAGDARVVRTGIAALMVRATDAILESFLQSYAGALLIITPLMFLTLGSFRLGTLAMAPNLAPIAVTLGTMGWLGIPLDTFTLLIGSIAIGLAVDDTIHFLYGFQKAYAKGGDAAEAIQSTLRTTGRALLATTTILVLGFLVFSLATLNNLVVFGLITAYTLFVAFIADLTLGPALLTLAERRGWWRSAAVRRGDLAL